MSYDYSVLAGTQGHMNHRKTDRLLELVRRERLPLVMFAEGGGGRPGDTDTTSVGGLDVPTFRLTAALSGQVPLVAIVSGYCFAGNAALAGACDVIIATPEASLGMGGPAMIEGGGLGVVAPDDVGPMSVMVPNGVVDLLVPDEPAAWPRRGATSRRSARVQCPPPGPPLATRPNTPTSGCSATSSRRTGYEATTCGRSSRRCATRAACSSCAPGSVSG
jgi:acetyl-CoA carboxylase carboxyltransferase component